MGGPRIPELDALRGIAILAVVALHVSFGFLVAAPPDASMRCAALAVHVLAAFGTPLFVALSLAGLALGHGIPRTAASYAAFLSSRARRILPAYVFWTMLTLLRSDPAALAHPFALAGYLLTGTAAYHLYFVPLVCTYYLAWPLFSRLAEAAARGLRVQAAIATVGCTLTLFVWHASSVGLVPRRAVLLPLFWLGYATAGVAAAPALRSAFARPARWSVVWLPSALLAAATGLVTIVRIGRQLGSAGDIATIAMATTIFQPIVMAYTFAAIAAAIAIVGRNAHRTGFLDALGRASYGIYLAHVLVLEVVVQRVLGRPDAGARPVTMIGVWMACVLLSYVLVRGMASVPGLAALVGERHPRALTPPAPTP